MLRGSDDASTATAPLIADDVLTLQQPGASVASVVDEAEEQVGSDAGSSSSAEVVTRTVRHCTMLIIVRCKLGAPCTVMTMVLVSNVWPVISSSSRALVPK